MPVSEFHFTMPGQPPTVNHSYRIVRQTVRDRFQQPVLGKDGTPKRVHTLAKTEEVRRYQQDLAMICRVSRPSAFAADWLIVTYDFYLRRDIDTDNALKSINDAIALALGMNDRRFQPVVLSKLIGVAEPRVRVGIYDAACYDVQVVKRGQADLA